MAVELHMHSSASLMNTTVYTLGQSKVECSLPSRRLFTPSQTVHSKAFRVSLNAVYIYMLSQHFEWRGQEAVVESCPCAKDSFPILHCCTNGHA
jgi:hypothetical protein